MNKQRTLEETEDLLENPDEIEVGIEGKIPDEVLKAEKIERLQE